MKTKFTFLVAMAIATCASSFAQVQNVLIDFGGDKSSAPWTVVAVFSVGNLAYDLFDSQTNTKLPKSQLKITDDFAKGPNLVGATVLSGVASDNFTVLVAGDNAYVHTLPYAEYEPNILNDNPTGGFEINNLDPAKYYSFAIFAARGNAGAPVADIREAKYTITGGDGSFEALLNASNNTSNVATILNVLPGADGKIFFSMQAGPNNNNSLGMCYLGAIKMTISDLEITEKDILASVTNPKIEKFAPVYKNGILRLGDYTGIVKLYDITGRKVVEGNAIFGHITTKLAKGTYIVKTATATAKFIAQ